MTKCRACKSEKIKTVLNIDFMPLINSKEKKYIQSIGFCQDCGLIFCTNPYTEIEWEEYYKKASSYAEAFYRKNENIAQWTKKRFKLQKDFILGNINEQISNVIEIGAATAYNLAQYKEEGYKVAGVEPSEKSVRDAKEIYGIDVYNCTAERFFEENTKEYDLVIVSHVLEHIFDLNNFVKGLNTISAKYVYIEVPTFSSKQIDGIKGVFIEEHLNYFTQESLCNLMNMGGFKLVAFTQDLKNERAWGEPIMSLWEKVTDAEDEFRYVRLSEQILKKYIHDDDLKEIEIKKTLEKIPASCNVAIYGANHATRKLIASYDLSFINLKSIYDDDIARYGTKFFNCEVQPFSVDDVKNKNIELILICTTLVSQKFIYQELKEMLPDIEIIMLLQGNK